VSDDALRPIERRVLSLVDSGIGTEEIGHRFRRSTGHIERLIELARLPDRVAVPHAAGLRPVERCILGWRTKGARPEEIGSRLHKSAGYVERVEGYARHKLANP
jgi:hypothetical protein